MSRNGTSNRFFSGFGENSHVSGWGKLVFNKTINLFWVEKRRVPQIKIVFIGLEIESH